MADDKKPAKKTAAAKAKNAKPKAPKPKAKPKAEKMNAPKPDDEAMKQVVALGYRQAPVVVAGDTHWAGFRPDLIAGIKDPA